MRANNGRARVQSLGRWRTTDRVQPSPTPVQDPLIRMLLCSKDAASTRKSIAQAPPGLVASTRVVQALTEQSPLAKCAQLEL